MGVTKSFDAKRLMKFSRVVRVEGNAAHPNKAYHVPRTAIAYHQKEVWNVYGQCADRTPSCRSPLTPSHDTTRTSTANTTQMSLIGRVLLLRLGGALPMRLASLLTTPTRALRRRFRQCAVHETQWRAPRGRWAVGPSGRVSSTAPSIDQNCVSHAAQWMTQLVTLWMARRMTHCRTLSHAVQPAQAGLPAPRRARDRADVR